MFEMVQETINDAYKSKSLFSTTILCTYVTSPSSFQSDSPSFLPSPQFPSFLCHADSPSSLLHQTFLLLLLFPLMNFALAFHLLTNFGCGYVLLNSFYRLLNFLGMLLMFALCFKVLRFTWRSKSSIRFLCDFGGIPRFRLCLDNVVWEVSNPKVAPLEKGRDPSSSSSTKTRSRIAGEKVNANSEDGSEGKDENEREFCNEDEVFDVMTLRKLVKVGRRKANVVCAELEEERTASSSSAEEAMAMILRLQGEKSSAEIQANQFRRMAEQKLEYDQDVIESLEWTITQCESQRSVLEDQLGILRKELKQFMTEDEINLLEVDDRSRGRGSSSGCDPEDSVVSHSETESQA